MPPDQNVSGGGPDRVGSSGDDLWLAGWLQQAWRRWRVWTGIRCAVVGIGVTLLATAILGDGTRATAVAALLGALLASLMFGTAAGVRSVAPLIGAVEAQTPALRNALVAWHETRARVSPVFTARLAADARRALDGAAWPRPGTRLDWGVALAVLALGAMGIVVTPLTSAGPAAARVSREKTTPATAAHGALQWVTTVTPPAYAQRPPVRAIRPARVDALAGARVEVTFTGWVTGHVVRLGSRTLALRSTGPSRVAEFIAEQSDVMLVQDAQQQVLATITVVVTPDAAPTVRIMAPAADLRRDAASGTVRIEIRAQDDLGLRDVRLRFTKVTGSGESFTFEDGEWPVTTRRDSGTAWSGLHTIDLAHLGLGPGDSIVYHAVAHDARPGPEGAAESERFLIEITRPGALAAGDFSLPEPEDRFALSQRMVIQLTERLLEQRPRMRAEEFLQQAQALAIAQRRVRAEFVFMLGGDVEDEFEEAAHSHEVEEGRQANQGKGDLTDAVRQMSQAETRLTAADVREALPYEYRALAAIQAAFGQARYFMRSLPVAVQLDATRRLQGDRTRAASARWSVRALPDTTRVAALDLLRRLEAPGVDVATVLPGLVALDRADTAWVAAVQQAATDEGAAGLTRALRTRILPGSTTWMRMPLPRSAVEGPAGPPDR